MRPTAEIHVHQSSYKAYDVSEDISVVHGPLRPGTSAELTGFVRDNVRFHDERVIDWPIVDV